jgi:hypothetical protein
LHHNCYDITFGNGCEENSLGVECGYAHDTDEKCCFNIKFGNQCKSNNLYGYDYDITFGNECEGNILDIGNTSITFGDNCTQNELLGSEIMYITFGNGCIRNKLYQTTHSVTFGQKCINNTFGGISYGITFGNGCHDNSIVEGENSDVLETDVRYIQYGNGVYYTRIYPKNTGDIQNIRVSQGCSGRTSSNPVYIGVDAGKNYEQIIAKNSSGNVKVVCLGDLGE